MQTAELTPEDIRANMEAAAKRVDRALAEYERARAELTWWQQGLRLFELGPDATAATDDDPSALIAELFPQGLFFDTGAHPTLRQAIVLVMRDNPQIAHWGIRDLAAALDERGWLPNRDDAAKGVSDMAAAMYNSGQLARLDRGIYKLPPPLEAALEGAAQANRFAALVHTTQRT